MQHGKNNNNDKRRRKHETVEAILRAKLGKGYQKQEDCIM